MKKEKILVTPVGTSDPIRSDHDGPMLHLIRSEKPNDLFIILTKGLEEEGLWDKIWPVLNHYFESWDYHPDVYAASMITENPFSTSEVAGPIIQIFKNNQLDKNYDEILMNTTSGTPAIMSIMEIEALEGNRKGLYVTNPDYKRGSNNPRTNLAGYNIENEILNNQDDLEDSPNRTYLNRIRYVELKKQQERVEGLLENYDYEAIRNIISIPTELLSLLDHLAYRLKLDYSNAQKIAESIDNLPFSLYPNDLSEEETRIAENFLLLKIFLETDRINDFLVRLDALFIYLEIRIIKKYLKELGIKNPDQFFIEDEKSGKTFLNFSLIEKELPELAEKLNSDLRGTYDTNAELGIRATTVIIRYLVQKGLIDEKKTFNRIDNLNYLRNKAAHSLDELTRDNLDNYLTPINSTSLSNDLQKIILKYFPNITEEYLQVYQNANNYILDYFRNIDDLDLEM